MEGISEVNTNIKMVEKVYEFEKFSRMIRNS